MIGQRTSRPLLTLGSFLIASTTAFAGNPRQTPQTSAIPRPSNTPPAAIAEALQANPITAPYPIRVTSRDGQYILSGTVGSKQVHDVAVRALISLGYPFRDDLAIDTSRAIRPPLQGVQTQGYVYPPPLFSRLDNPFFGMEPPLVSYAPYWPAVAAREPISPALANPADPFATVSPPPSSMDVPYDPADNSLLPSDKIELTLDASGVAVLRGRVRTLADRLTIGQTVAATRGISEVVNLLQVDPAAPPLPSDTPPPPPTPAFPGVPRVPAPPQAAQPLVEIGAPAPIVPERDPLARNIDAALARRPALAALPLKVTLREGVATLSGRVPSAYEAMLAFRAVEQTPGVRGIVDRLEYAFPDADKPNPLQDKGRPEDVEPFLLIQVRRQLGDIAHVDQLKLRGDTLEIRGTVSSADDLARAEATLRSIPLLRGFKLDPTFLAD